MSSLKYKEIKKMSKEEREKKLKELKMELIKSKINASRNKNSKTKEIKKIIARIITLNNSDARELKIHGATESKKQDSVRKKSEKLNNK